MARRSRSAEISEDLNIWPSFTDLMSNAFMILSLLLLLALVKSLLLQSSSQQNQSAVQQLQEENKKLQADIERLKSPPLIAIKDSRERSRFASGSAEVSPELRLFIFKEVVSKIEGFSKDYKGYIVDVIGHTDGEETVTPASNLDQILEQVALGQEKINNLKAGSNADLGLMRAVAVVKELEKVQKKGRLKNLKFRAYSAAQLFMTNGEYATMNRASDPTRRRIEIRFTPPAVER